MTNTDPVMEPIFTKTIPCPGVGILKVIPCSAARPCTEKCMSTPRDRLLKICILFAAHMEKLASVQSNSGQFQNLEAIKR